MKNTALCNVVVLISGSGSNLQALIDSQSSDNPMNICAVISNKANAYGLTRATLANIETRIVEHSLFADRKSFENELINIIDTFQPQLIVLAGFMRILGRPFVQHFKGRLLNIHPSLLPKYKGLNTHKSVLDSDDTQHGCSIHFVTEELDGGPLILQAIIPIQKQDTIESLSTRVQQQEHIAYPQVVRWFAEKRLYLDQQKVMLDNKALPKEGYILKV